MQSLMPDNLETSLSPDIDVVGQTISSQYFDAVIGHIEDIIMGDEFVLLHEQFLEAHWQSIAEEEENKLEYMHIFEIYTRTFEDFLEAELHRRMEDFDMQLFSNELEKHDVFGEPLYSGEIFELLHSFVSFECFKELMLDYRSKKEGRTQHLTACDILVTQHMSPPGKDFSRVATGEGQSVDEVFFKEQH